MDTVYGQRQTKYAFRLNEGAVNYRSGELPTGCHFTLYLEISLAEDITGMAIKELLDTKGHFVELLDTYLITYYNPAFPI